MDAKLRIELPWPAAVLSPNGRVHWARKSKAVAKHREWAYIAAIAAMRQCGWPKGVLAADIRTTFIDPTPRRRDRDNHQSMNKSYLDGFADAGVIANDSGFVTHPVEFIVGPKRGVRFDITIADKRAA